MDLKRSRPGVDADTHSSKRSSASVAVRPVGASSDGPLADELIEDAMELNADDVEMEDVDYDEAAAADSVLAAAEGEEVTLGEAGRNWERAPPPELKPQTQPLGATGPQWTRLGRGWEATLIASISSSGVTRCTHLKKLNWEQAMA